MAIRGTADASPKRRHIITTKVEHPAVLECAVVPGVDGADLVKPKAFVVLNRGEEPSEALAQSIKDHVKSVLAHYKYPRWVEFVDELPKTPTGKIKRFELRKLGELRN